MHILVRTVIANNEGLKNVENRKALFISKEIQMAQRNINGTMHNHRALENG
jgi:hypothetical protein